MPRQMCIGDRLASHCRDLQAGSLRYLGWSPARDFVAKWRVADAERH